MLKNIFTEFIITELGNIWNGYIYTYNWVWWTHILYFIFKWTENLLKEKS